jgi:hypothetical protein
MFLVVEGYLTHTPPPRYFPREGVAELAASSPQSLISFPNPLPHRVLSWSFFVIHAHQLQLAENLLHKRRDRRSTECLLR